MLQNIGLNTDSFYKFVTTLSLISTIYFFSFGELFVRPYNSQMTEINLTKAKQGSDVGYYTGVSRDLMAFLNDSLVKEKVSYFYYSSKDTSDELDYYSTIYLHGEQKEKVDSLNLINKKLAEAKFSYKALGDLGKVLDQTILRKQWLSIILGFISAGFFVFGTAKWFTYRKKIDK